MIGSLMITGKAYLRQLDSVSGPLAIASVVAVAAFTSQWWVVPLVAFWVWYTFAEGMAAGISFQRQGDREHIVTALSKMLRDLVERAKKEGVPMEIEGLDEALDSCALKQRCAKTGKDKSCGNCSKADPDKVVAALQSAQKAVEVHMKMRQRKERTEAKKAANQAHVDAGGELDLPVLDEDFFGKL